VLPLALFFLFLTMGTIYYFSREAITNLAETWLETRLSEALQIAEEQVELLHRYGLEAVPASIAKAKMDASTAIASIEVGKLGYIFVVSAQGIITLHPDKDLVGRGVRGEAWFKEIKREQIGLVYWGQDSGNLAMYGYFEPWQWFVLASDSKEEIFSVTNKMKPYIIYLAILASVAMSIALMFLARRFTEPLQSLTAGADRIGKGDLKTRISIPGRDEFSHLAEVFNQMAAELQNTLTTLQQREEHFRSIIENASDFISILDAEGVYLYASPSMGRILGYRPGDLIGRNSFDFIHADDRKDIKFLFDQRVKSNTKMSPTEFRINHRDGTWRTMEAVTKNLLNHPAVGGFVVNSRDITKRKQALEALHQSHQELERRVQERTAQLKSTNRELKEFAFVVSHDLKAPLRAISQLTHWISEDYADAFDREGKEMMGLILNRVKRMDGLIEGVLSYSRIGRIKERMEILDLNVLVHELIESIMAPPHIHIGIENVLPVIQSDPIRMQQVFQNLLGNAITYMDKREGVVTVGCVDEGVHWKFSVSDNGPGIDRSYHVKIFQIFQTLAPRDKHESSGIGLTLVKKIIEQYGGSIWVESEPGKGSTFYFTLPNNGGNHVAA
ncbi:MAG: PAS domain S-box protein, partial [Deltaproteobacteria bacterium]|nr:PAS domain S-box protein [Deltaproteobacteria bacterium]